MRMNWTKWITRPTSISAMEMTNVPAMLLMPRGLASPPPSSPPCVLFIEGVCTSEGEVDTLMSTQCSINLFLVITRVIYEHVGGLHRARALHC
jgi:hypothetical protein